MKVLLINTSERTGGAAIAAGRLMESLCAMGADAQMLVLNKESRSPRVQVAGTPWRRRYNFLWERVVIWAHNLFSRKNLFTVSIANTGMDITKLPAFQEADIVHLHWINQGMLSLDNLKKIVASGKPVVWTLHDMWPCTAICHHPYTCEGFKNECKECPFLRFPGKKDLANRVFWQKRALFAEAHLNIVAVSRWLAGQVRQSSLLKGQPVAVIPNTLSPADFQLMEKEQARKALNLPDKRFIVFGAARIDDPIKGFHYLLQALRLLVGQGTFGQEELHLLLFGRIKREAEVLASIPVGYTYFGSVRSTMMLSQIYSAADVAVSTSFYETFGQTLIEAQACGCVPVSFGNSGQADIIQHKRNGYLADYLSEESLAQGILWGLTEGTGRLSGREMRGDVFGKYAGRIVAKQYLDLYKRLTEEKEEDTSNQPCNQHTERNA